MLKSKEKETSKDTEKKERRERQPSNHLIASQTEYICIDNDGGAHSESLARSVRRAQSHLQVVTCKSLEVVWNEKKKPDFFLPRCESESLEGLQKRK